VILVPHYPKLLVAGFLAGTQRLQCVDTCKHTQICDIKFMTEGVGKFSFNFIMFGNNINLKKIPVQNLEVAQIAVIVQRRVSNFLEIDKERGNLVSG
jgi:hypothetical protein